MSDAVLTRRSAFDGLALPGDARLLVVPAGEATRFVLRGGEAAAGAACATLGLDPPAAINRAAGAPARGAARLGPDEWLLIAAGEDGATLAARLRAALAGAPHSLVEVSQRQDGLVLDGALAAIVLSSGCPLDLRAAAFPVGAATRTLFHKAEIVLWRTAAERFHLEIVRSFAPYVVGHLAEARRASEDL
jgi:sarcosine oxidase subunit gamma